MKTVTFRMLCVLALSFFPFTQDAFAQAPQKFNYQGIARDAKGNPMSQQAMSLKISVLPAADATSPEYEEVQTVTTNEFGLYTLQIGTGKALTGDMNAVKWETGNKYIRVAIDPTGGTNYLDAGTAQLLSVPYALYADRAGSAKSGSERTGAVSSNATHVAGDANYITKFTALNVIGKSRLFDNGTSIGLGTTTPVASAAMHIRRTTSGQYLYMENPDTIGFGSFRLYNDVPANFATFTKYGSKTTGGYTGISALYPFANMLGYGNNGPFLNAGTGNIGFAITKAGTNKLKIHIDAAAERVGFGGNAVPQAPIHFNNTAVGNDTVKFTNQSTGHTAADGTEFQFGGTTTRLMNRENAALIFGTNNADRVTIGGTGNVGIGTSSPAATLDVNGQLRIQGGAPGAGKVLTSDASGLASWQTPAAGGGSGPWTLNGIHIHNNNSGNVGVGITNPTARFQVVDSSVVFSAGGDTSISSPNAPPPLQGAGRRLMWFPQRGAFRAGGVGLTDAQNWDRDSIGLYSMALGWNTKATERASFAAGERAQANGFASISLGDDTRANGIRSVAMGDGSQANGSSSLATGEFTQANGPFSTAMGANSQANANFSMATGLATVANGVSSTAMGSVTQANGNASTSMGELTQANGMYSTAMGNNTQANGFSSLVLGQYNDTLVAAQNSMTASTPLLTVGNGTSPATRSNALVVLNNGNVAVGNINPTAKLEIDGQVKINGGAPGNGKVLVSDASGLATWQTPPLGPAGADGKSVLNGVVNPAAGTGNNGDFYINTLTNQIFGPKTAGVWGSGTSLVGPAGATGPAGANGAAGPQGPAGPQGIQGLTGPAGPAGAAGPQGPAGPAGPAGVAGLNGNTILNGALNPTGADGVDGDFYLNIATNEIFGPKSGGVWGGGTSLLGPAGPAGPQGPTGLLPSASAAGNTPYWDGFNWEVNSANIFNNGNYIGIGSALPTTKLDVNGDLALRTFNLSLVNGSNAIITPAQQYSYYRITGPTAAYSIYGIGNAQEGRLVTLFNATNFPLTLQNMVPLAGANALRTGTADVTIGAYGSATLQFNTTDNLWALVSTSGTTAAGSSWLTTGNAAAGTLSIGTTTNHPYQFISNNLVRGRVNSADGEFVWGGAAASPYAGDGLTSVATASLPFALAGYSAQNGSGTWGEILTGSTTAFSAVQGVYGGSGTGAGVLGNYNGTNTSLTRAGVYGVCSAPAANMGGAGVHGYNGILSGNQRMGVLGTYNGAAFGIGVHGIAFGGGVITGNNDVAVVGWRANNSNYSGYFNGNHVIANGTKSASVATSKGNQLLYVTETPGVFFEDIGRSQLVNGEAVVQLDPLFLETIFVDSTHPMHVFVQMEGESEDVYVVPGTTSFKVKEKKQGTSNAAFSYRIMAKRMNFQDHRFGNDPVWGEGDTRQFAQYATPPPVNYADNVKFQEEQRKNWKPTPMPKGFRYLQDLQQEGSPATERPADKR